MRTSGEDKLAAGDEGPKAINSKENSEISDSLELQLTDQMDIGESSLREIDDNSSENNEILSLIKSCGDTKEEEKEMPESSRIDDPSIEWGNASDESKSEQADSESKSKEINVGTEEINRQKLYSKFKRDPKYKKLTPDIITKIKNHYKIIKNIKCTKFIKTMYNLFKQHLGIPIEDNNQVWEIDDETKEYFFYIFKEIDNQGLFTWEVFKDLIRNNCRTFEAMSKYWMVTDNWNKISANSNSASNQGSDGFLLEDPIAKLLNEDFYKAERFNLLQSKYWVTNKPKYLSNIKKIIEYYAKSRKWSNKEMDLILKKNKSDIHVFSKLVELKLITEKNNILTFKEKEIKKYCDQNNF